MGKIFRYLLLSMILIAQSGCSVIRSGTMTVAGNEYWSESTTPEPGLGGVVGEIENADEIWPGKVVSVYTANFYGDAEGEGAFILEPTVFPKAKILANGSFRIMNIQPSEYVLIVGPSAESGIPMKEGGRVRIFTVEADEVLDIGLIRLAP